MSISVLAFFTFLHSKPRKKVEKIVIVQCCYCHSLQWLTFDSTWIITGGNDSSCHFSSISALFTVIIHHGVFVPNAMLAYFKAFWIFCTSLIFASFLPHRKPPLRLMDCIWISVDLRTELLRSYKNGLLSNNNHEKNHESILLVRQCVICPQV